jgi:DNA polymerase elongation subunit (family B)
MDMVPIKYVLVAAASATAGYLACEIKYGRKWEKFLESESKKLGEEIEGRLERKYKRKFVQEVTDADPEFAEAAINAAEALKTYSDVDVRPEVLASEMINTFEKPFAETHLENSHEEDKKGISPEARTLAFNKMKEAAQEAAGNRAKKDEPGMYEDVTVLDIASMHPTNYQAISTPAKEVKMEGTPPVTESSQTEIITPNAYMENQFSYKQYSLTYFARTDTLASASDRILSVDVRKAAVGEKIMKKLATGRSAMGGLDTIYIRNHEKGMELEVERVETRYDEVTGITLGSAPLADLGDLD